MIFPKHKVVFFTALLLLIVNIIGVLSLKYLFLKFIFIDISNQLDSAKQNIALLVVPIFTVSFIGLVLFFRPLFQKSSVEKLRVLFLRTPAFVASMTLFIWFFAVFVASVLVIKSGYTYTPINFAHNMLSTLSVVLVSFVFSYFMHDYINRRYIFPQLFDNNYDCFKNVFQVNIKGRFLLYFTALVLAPLAFLAWIILWIATHEASLTTLQINFIAGYGVFIVVAGIALTMLFIRSFNKPIQQVIQVTNEITHGNFDAMVSLESSDELGLLSMHINTMASTLDSNLKEAKRKDQQLQLQSRMASMGEMLGNITHQWKQPVSAISAVVSNIQLQHELESLELEILPTYLDNIKEQLDLMQQTTKDFLDYYKPSKQAVVFSVDKTVTQAIKLTKGTLISNQIEIVFDENIDSVHIMGHANELNQVLINIINNAKDALISNNIANKCIWINVTQSQDKVCITLEDNATGIPESIIDKIFDPYFTTKGDTTGTGIGLQMSKQIIQESMNGTIAVHNTSRGACFTIEFTIDKDNA